MGNKKNIYIILIIFSLFIFSFGFIAASEVSGPTYNISGYVFDNFGSGLGGVNVIQVENASNTNTTSTSGYYWITGLPNGTYNFSYSKPGFETGYLEVSINDADTNSANITIFDLTSPGQVSGLVNDTPTQTSVNISWIFLTDANYYQVFRNSSSLGFTKNTSWSDTGLNPSTLYRYWVRANDSYNNWGADSDVLSIVTSAIPDSTPPTVTITSTVSSPTNNSLIPMTATFSEDVTGFVVGDIIVNNGAASNLAGSGTFYTFEVTPSGQGTVTVNIPSGAAQDAAGNGNTAATQFSIIYDSNPPAVMIISHSNNSILNTSTIAVSGTASDTGSGVQKVEVSVDGNAFAPATGTTSWSFTTSTLSDGTHTITAKATDDAGNTAETSVTVILDTTPPVVAITYPADGQIFNTSSITVSGTASDARLDKVEVKVGNGGWQTASGTTSWSLQVTLSEGSNTISARATDTAGNTKEASINVTLDTTPPASVTNANTYTRVGSFYINNSWVNPTDPDFNKVWFRNSDGTTLQNIPAPANYLNLSWSPHYTQNISAQTVDAFNNRNPEKVWFNASIPNNPIYLNNIVDSYSITEGQTLYIDADYSDLDNDIGTFARNFSSGTFDTSTGILTWTTKDGDQGTYNWQISINDGWGSISTKNFVLSVGDSTPTIPTSLSYSTGNFWVNHTWKKGVNTDSFNISHNETWYYGKTDSFFNATVGPHGWSNISIAGYNSTLGAVSESASQNVQVPNNPIQITNVSDNYSVWEGQTLYLHAIWVDLDGDGASSRIRLKGNYNNASNSFDRDTGILNMTTVEGDRGNYSMSIDIDGNDKTKAIKYFTITVFNSTPGTPTDLSSTAGNFWINNTWKGVNSDKFNIDLHNGTWKNGTNNSFFNASVEPHGWSNITVYGRNSYLPNKISTGASQNTQVPNNIPSVPEKIAPLNGPNFADRNITLSWNGSSDADGDILTYDWQVSDQAGFSNIVKSGSSPTLSSVAYLSPGTYFWRVRANDSRDVSDWSTQSNAPDFKIMAPPNIANIKAIILNETSAKIEWVTDQSNSSNKVQYGYSPALSDSKSEWNNNTARPSFTLTGLQGKSIYYQVFSYNNTNSSAFSNSSIFDVYPLKFSIKFIEPGITSDGNETWLDAHVGHVGKYIGVDGTFRNMGPDPLYLSITELYNNETSNWVAFRPLAPGENLSYMKVFGRPAFEINSSGVSNYLFNFTFGINISTGYTSYNNSTTLSLPILPIFKIKWANGGIVAVGDKNPTVITYTIEANSSVNLTRVNIYDHNPSAPKKDEYRSFNYSTLEANEPIVVNYTYSATTADLSSNKCEESKLTNGSYPCIINLARFTATWNGTTISDTDYVELPVCRENGDCNLIIPERKPNTGSGGTNGNNNYVTGAGSKAPGGGGGGAPGSGEDFANIQSREVRGMNTLAFTSTAYVFTSSEPIMVVSFVSSVTANDVPVAVEVLKNRSKFIDKEAPGNLYKYFNVNVGSFRSKIGNGVVVYRVNNSWFEENDLEPGDVNIYKWVDGTWVEKNTRVVESKPNYTYFASLVGNFSSFAIAGGKKSDAASISINAVPQEESVINPISEKSTASQQKSASLNTFKLPFNMPNIPIMYALIFGIGLVIIAVAYRVKNNTINLKNFGLNNTLSTTWLNGLWKDDRNKLYSWITSSFSVVKTKHFSRQGTYNLLKAVLLFISILVIVSIIKYLPIERLSLPASNQWIIFIVTLAIGQILVAFIYFRNKKNMNAISRSRPALSSNYVSGKPSFKNPGISIINLKNHINIDSNSLIKSGLLIVLSLIIALIIYFRPLHVEYLKLPIVFIIIFGIGQLLVMIIYFKNKKNKTI